MKATKVVEISDNSKTGKVSVTNASQATCPKSCPFYNAGCYAQNGYTGFVTHALNKSPITDILEIAKEEAEGILSLTGKLDLRIHVVGDSPTDEAAQIVSQAAMKHMAKHGRKAWAYTHAHNVKRESWGDVSVLRSCETLEQISKAHDDGFATAMVVPEFQSDKPYNIGDGFIGIPCRNQIDKNIQCVDCRLCFHDRILHKSKRVILFAPHGSQKNKVKLKVSS